MALYLKLTVNHGSRDQVLNSLLAESRPRHLPRRQRASPKLDARQSTSLHFLTGQFIIQDVLRSCQSPPTPLHPPPDPSLLPDGVVGRAEVDEEIPAPVPHGQQVSHAAQVHGQQTGPAPDGGHAPGRHAHIRIKGS